MGRRWTAEDDETLRLMSIDGYYAYEIGETLGRTKMAVESRRHALGINYRGGGPRAMRLTDRQGRAVELARDAGYTWREIAKKVRSCPDTIRKAYKRWCDDGLGI